MLATYPGFIFILKGKERLEKNNKDSKTGSCKVQSNNLNRFQTFTTRHILLVTTSTIQHGNFTELFLTGFLPPQHPASPREELHPN